MFDQLRVYNLPLSVDVDMGKIEAQRPNIFTLSTCQRHLIIELEAQKVQLLEGEHEYYHKAQAYQFLLEVICGLKSSLLGENEIVSQFKKSFGQYLNKATRSPLMISLIEKLLKDSKEIRTQYLREIGQKTYAGLVRKLALNCDKGQNADILIVGSGELANDLINQLKKKSRLFITARNTDKVNNLCQKHSIERIKWRDYANYMPFRTIIVAIKSTSIHLNSEFIDQWCEFHALPGLLVDLCGDTGSIDTKKGISDGIYRLKDIFGQGVLKEQQKMAKIKQAKEALAQIVVKRENYFSNRIKGCLSNTDTTKLELEKVSLP